MQTTRQNVLSLEISNRGPVELSFDELHQVSGGADGPHDNWLTTSPAGPHDNWLTTSPAGPHDNW